MLKSTFDTGSRQTVSRVLRLRFQVQRQTEPVVEMLLRTRRQEQFAVRCALHQFKACGDCLDEALQSKVLFSHAKTEHSEILVRLACHSKACTYSENELAVNF